MSKEFYFKQFRLVKKIQFNIRTVPMSKRLLFQNKFVYHTKTVPFQIIQFRVIRSVNVKTFYFKQFRTQFKCQNRPILSNSVY